MVDEEQNAAEQEEIEEQTAAPRGSTVPLIITLAALTIYFGFQSLQLVSERGNLGLVKSNQDAALQEAQKVQTQFKTLVTKTSQLADQGHAGARMVMEELQKRGLGGAPEAPVPETKAPGKTEAKPTK